MGDDKYVHVLIELQGHPDQGALIPTENPTMEEVINIAEGKVENNGVQSLFDTGRSEGNQTDQTSGRMADRVLQSPSAGTETNLSKLKVKTRKVPMPKKVPKVTYKKR